MMKVILALVFLCLMTVVSAAENKHNWLLAVCSEELKDYQFVELESFVELVEDDESCKVYVFNSFTSMIEFSVKEDKKGIFSRS